MEIKLKVQEKNTKLLGYRGVDRDITECELVREELEKKEKQFRMMFENMNNAVAVYRVINDGEDFVFEEFNLAGERIEKIKREDLIGRSLLSVFPGVRDFGLLDVFQRVWKTGVAEHFPTSFYKDQRIYGWRENYIYKLSSDRIVAIYEDVTECKQVEEALKTSEKRYHNLIEFANVGIITTENGEITQINKKAEALYGYSKNELIGKSPSILTLEKYNNQHRKMIDELLRSGRAEKVSFEEEGVKKGGTLFPIEISYSLSRSEGKEDYSIIAILKDITERKRAEIELKETKEFLENVIETTVDGIMIADASGNIINLNNALEKMTGLRKEELIGEHASIFISEDKEIRKMFREKAAELFEKGNTSYETVLKGRDGKITEADVNSSLIKNAEGDIKAGVSVFRDITEKKKIAKEIRETKDFLENVIESSRDGIVITNEMGNIISTNKSLERMVGTREGELIGKHASELTIDDKEMNKEIREKTAELFEKGFTFYEAKHRTEEGKTIDVECNSSLVKDNNGNCVGGISIVRDISARKHADEALRESKEKYHSLIEHANDAIVSANQEGAIVTFNRKAEEMYGYACEEILGKSMFLLASPQDREQQKKSIEKFKTIKASEIQRRILETKGFRKDGREFPAEVSIFSLETKEGTIFTSFIRDITSRKKMEQQLLQSEKLKSLGELAGGVAHDFNNCLAAILGRAQLLKMDLEAPQGMKEKRKYTLELKRSLEIIEQATRDGADTVRRIQEFARKRVDDKDLTQVDINELINQSLELTRVKWKNESEEKGIKIDIQKELSSLPSTTGCASELREVFTNLINNAVDAMPNGGHIKIKTLEKQNHISIKIEDTGIGVPKDIMGKIFDPFFTTKGVQSTGLGMSVSYGIINRHQGTIKVDSVEGKGTTFTIRLPISEKAIKEEKVDTMPGEQRKARILVIEDEEEILNVLASILTRSGHEVESASNGEQGIELFKKKEFDLLFTDLGMPGMSGWQVAEKIKSINGRVPVGVITGWGIKLDDSEMKDKWIDLIIQKPFEVEQVLKLVQEGMILRDQFKAA